MQIPGPHSSPSQVRNSGVAPCRFLSPPGDSDACWITEIFRNNQLDVAIKRECGLRKRTVPKDNTTVWGLEGQAAGWWPQNETGNTRKTGLVVSSKPCAVPVGHLAGCPADTASRRPQTPLVADIYCNHKEVPKELGFWHGKKGTRGQRSPLRESKLAF